jgi:hypothetical protein
MKIMVERAVIKADAYVYYMSFYRKRHVRNATSG